MLDIENEQLKLGLERLVVHEKKTLTGFCNLDGWGKLLHERKMCMYACIYVCVCASNS